MELTFQHIDAFTDQVFGGNPAAVVPLQHWAADPVLQQIAAEHNLSETAFYAPEGEDWRIRWFTPLLEVDLCGHATLAAAWSIFSEYPLLDRIRFLSRSGPLPVERKEDVLYLDFPLRRYVKAELPAVLREEAVDHVEAGSDEHGVNLVLVLDSPDAVQDYKPNLLALAQMPYLGLIVTAPGDSDDADFVCRYFAPRAGINEDPVTGSAYCTLIPYWAERLGKLEMFARQLSKRGGEVFCRYDGERAHIGGKAALYAKGVLYLP